MLLRIERTAVRDSACRLHLRLPQVGFTLTHRKDPELNRILTAETSEAHKDQYRFEVKLRPGDPMNVMFAKEDALQPRSEKWSGGRYRTD